MLLSIIIINYNTFELTCNCIRSIKETTVVPHEIILVDNNSKECAPSNFFSVFPDLQLISLQENVGFGRANNRGVAEAKGKYVLLLNSDTLINEATIDETVNYLEKNSDVDILGCRVLFENNATQTTVIKYEGEDNLFSALAYFVKRNSFFIQTRLFVYNLKEKCQDKKRSINQRSTILKTTAPISPAFIPRNHYKGKKIGSLVGVFLLLKKSVYIESKGFDPDFFMYYEEIEWFLNRLNNYNIVYYPHASVIHYQGSSDVHRKMNLQFYVSSYLFWYKMGYAQYFFYLLYFLIEIPSRLMVRFVFGQPRPSKDIPSMLKSIPYFFKILRHRNKYGSRPSMLKLNYLKKNNL